MKQKQPETSREAWDSMRGKPVMEHHRKILTALEQIGTGMYEDIARHIGWTDFNAVSRRTKEMETLGLIEKTGEKRKTSSNRSAFTYRLPQPKSDTSWLTGGTEVLDGEKWLGVKDDAPKTEKNQVIQQSLFK